MKWFSTLGLTIAFVGTLNAISPAADPGGSWREPLRCGPNTLHAYLNLHGRREPLEAIDARVPVGPAGATMADLARAATELGVASRVVRSAPDRLADWPLPTIAHLGFQEGHHLLVLRLKGSEVMTADLSSGEIRDMPYDSFAEIWSGYLLVPGSGSERRIVVVVIGSVVAALMILMVWHQPLQRSKPALGGAGLLMIAGVGLATWSGPNLAAAPPHVSASPILARPVVITPTWTRDEVDAPPIAPDRWALIAAILRPDRRLPNVGHLVHQRENWAGHEIDAAGTRALTADAMAAILLDGQTDDLFAIRRPLVHFDLDGRPRFARYGDNGSEPHAHQYLAICAAMGVPSDRPIHAPGVTTTIADLVRTARGDFHLEGELEWASMMLARYTPTRATWTNRWGNTYSFDTIAGHFLNQPLGEGACAGTHVLQTLTVLLRVDAEHPLFRFEVTGRIRARLREAVALLAASQRPDGSWAPDWFHPLADASTARFDDLLYGSARQAQMTGHHLEWLQLLPESMSSGIDRRRAIAACVAAMERASADEVWADLCPYSHCFRMARRYAGPEVAAGEFRP